VGHRLVTAPPFWVAMPKEHPAAAEYVEKAQPGVLQHLLQQASADAVFVGVVCVVKNARPLLLLLVFGGR